MKSTELKEGYLLQGEFFVSFVKQMLQIEDNKEPKTFQRVGIKLEDKTIEVDIQEAIFRQRISYGDTLFVRGHVSYLGWGDSRPRVNALRVAIVNPHQMAPVKPQITEEKYKKALKIVIEYERQQAETKQAAKIRNGHPEPLMGVAYEYVAANGEIRKAVWRGREFDYNNLWDQRILRTGVGIKQAESETFPCDTCELKYGCFDC